MIGKIIGGIAGSQLAKHSQKLGGVGGTLLGVVAVPMVKRMRLPGLLALGAGGYVLRKIIDRKQAERDGEVTSKQPPE